MSSLKPLKPCNPYNLEANDLESLLGIFKEYLTSEKISKGSIRSYLSDTRFFFAWLTDFLMVNKVIRKTNLSPPTLLGQINERLLETFKDSQLNSAPTTTINRRLSSLRRFGAFLEASSLQMNPFDTLSNVKEETEADKDPHRLEEFRLELWKKGLSKTTIKNYLSDVKQFIGWKENFLSQKP
jgi:site-specific recombinase XerD